ncbi:unnamed protein product [Arctia plantaginis]|uniref:Uncharacterized protein n=1 Tax=Arctia plantaginis TaxID=874455 RepID=A0A8S1BHF2_ARCPL|nr:unnamed protein product [Arctia plantaginis]
MEIRRWFFFILTNCILTQYLEGKSVSLNELIAAESQAKQSEEKHPIKFRDRETEETSSDEILTSETKIKRLPKKLPPLKLPGLLKRSPLLRHLASKAKLARLKLSNRISAVEKLSPLSLKKAFQIKSPLKPKKLQVGRRLRHKRKNQSKKREINQNDHFKHQYVPVLKSLNLLFDNLLNSDTSDSYDIKPKKYKHNRSNSKERYQFPNDYSNKGSARITKHRSNKKAVAFASSSPTKVTSDTKNFPSSKDYDYSANRPNKIIPILLSRNTTSSRRNNNGTSKRSSTTFDRDIEGNITRYHGDNEHITRRGEDESNEEGDEDNTYSATRNESSGIGHSRGNGNDTRNSKDREIFDGSESKNKNTIDNFGENQLETRGNQTKSESSVRKPLRRLRGFVPEDKISDERVLPEPIRSEEVYEESILSATDNSSSDKRVIDKSSPFTAEDENVRKRNETVILVERNSNYSQGSGKKLPVVMIFDGYSVTRDKNGENKVLGKTIHIH